MKDRELELKKKTIPYRLRVIFDGEEIRFPGCSHLYCEFEEFTTFMLENLEFDNKKINNYCEGGVENYENELKYK